MKTLRPEDLPALPSEIKALVREGVYSLYEIRNPGARYLLLTKDRNEFYFLSAAGDVVKIRGIRRVADANVAEVVTFAGPGAGEGIRINLQ